MKNYEKYVDKIREHLSDNVFCAEFVEPYILKSDNCDGLSCGVCHMIQMLWLLEDYEEPEVYWSKVEVDTPILVRTDESTPWVRRYFAKYEDGHFAKYENGIVYAWNLGRTSWSATNDKDVSAWPYAKLAGSEEE